MTKHLDLTGRRFGMLICQSVSPDKIRGSKAWICLCDCGKEVVLQTQFLFRGQLSCGCILKQGRPKHNHAHVGMFSATYWSWTAMRARCFYAGHRSFPIYGGRGITVCERWKDFKNFLADMGERPKERTLDRIDPDGNYEPSNCRWASPLTQFHNRRISTIKET